MSLGTTLEDETCDESSDEEESLLSYQEHSVSAIVYENASLIIDTLYQLSFRIRNSTPRPRFPESRPSSQVNEDTWLKPEEDRQVEEKISDVSGAYHHKHFPSQGSYKQIDKNEVQENEIDEDRIDADYEAEDDDFNDDEFDDNAYDDEFDDNAYDNLFDLNRFDELAFGDNVKSWDITAPMSITSPRETRQEDSRPLESSPQEMNKPTTHRRDKEILDSPYLGLEPDKAFLYQGGSNSNTPVSVINESNISLSSSKGPLSFYVLIESLEPNYLAQPAQHGPYGHWIPPTIRTGYTTKMSNLFHSADGIMTHIAVNEAFVHLPSEVHSAATIFTHNPDTPHLLVVPFDARIRHVYRYPGAWRPLTFRHVRIANSEHTYSAVSANGDRQHIAAQGTSHWMPQLLPEVYNDQSQSTRKQAGLIGSLPILIALAAFSAPISFLKSVLTSCVRPGRWQPHQYQYPAGRKL